MASEHLFRKCSKSWLVLFFELPHSFSIIADNNFDDVIVVISGDDDVIKKLKLDWQTFVFFKSCRSHLRRKKTLSSSSSSSNEFFCRCWMSKDPTRKEFNFCEFRRFKVFVQDKKDNTLLKNI